MSTEMVGVDEVIWRSCCYLEDGAMENKDIVADMCVTEGSQGKDVGVRVVPTI